MANHNRPGAHDDLVDAIPMNKTKPTTLIFGVGAAVIVLGTVAFTFMGGKKKSGDEGAQQPQVVAAPTTTMTPEEQKKHLEITRKSLEAFEAQKKHEAAEKAEKAAPEPHAGGGAPAPAAAGPAAAAPRPAAAAAPAPAPAPAKPAKKVSKKDQADLDGLKDIATQLGK
jgi:hypothetical protein